MDNNIKCSKKKPIAKKIIKTEQTKSNVSDSDSDSETLDFTKNHISRETIEKIAGMKVGEDLTLYRRVFVHKSIQKLIAGTQNVCKYMKESNETLEFVGDAMLGAVIADYLYRKFPNKKEGFLTTTRTKIVKSETLSYFGKQIGMDGKILMGRQAINTGGMNNKRFLEDAFEAFCAAIYYDKGFLGVQKFIINVLDKHFDETKIHFNDNYKDIFHRYAQSIKTDLPVYNIIKESGPSHDKQFIIEVCLFGERQGKGKAKTIKKAEQLATKEAIKLMGIKDPAL